MAKDKEVTFYQSAYRRDELVIPSHGTLRLKQQDSVYSDFILDKGKFPKDFKSEKDCRYLPFNAHEKDLNDILSLMETKESISELESKKCSLELSLRMLFNPVTVEYLQLDRLTTYIKELNFDTFFRISNGDRLTKSEADKMKLTPEEKYNFYAELMNQEKFDLAEEFLNRVAGPNRDSIKSAYLDQLTDTKRIKTRAE